MSLTAGTRVGPYQIVTALGAGGMGEVYRALDTRLNREVALKVLSAAVVHDPDRLRRFEQEARAAAALNHPNILAVFDFGSDGDTPYVISELLEGETLRQRIGAHALPVRKAVDYALQTAQGLAAAHQKNIVHRDLKPENLFLTTEGRIKILDFGLAKLMGTDSSAAGATSAPTAALETSPGCVMGTAGYMSPEQVRGRKVDYRSDIFSLGAVLYEMLTGRRAFQAESTVETLNAILTHEPPELSGTGTQVPPALDQIVRHCLEKSPDERFQSARDLAFALERLSVAATAPAPPPLTATPKRILPRRWLLAAAAGLACVAVGAYSGRLFWHSTAASASAFQYTPFATESRIQSEPAWSPDGSTLAYATSVDGVFQIATRSLSAATRAVITKSAWDCRFPFWSPDGSRIYYLSGELGATELWAVGAAGGAPERIIPDVLAADVLPDGHTIVFLRWERDKLALYRQSLPEPPVPYRDIALARGNYQAPYLRISPDGRQIGISAAAGEGVSRFWVVPVAGGADRQVFATRMYTRGAANLIFGWLPDSRRVLFSGSTGRRAQNHILMADTRSASLTPVTLGMGQEVSPAVSPDGRRIAFGTYQTDVDVIEMPLDGSPPRGRLTTSQGEHCPTWAPSGLQFAYAREVGGMDQIWLHSVADAVERPLVVREVFRESTERVSEPAFSPDGTRVAFARVSGGKFTIWVISAAGGPPVPLVRDGSQQSVPEWSPDGNWIAFISGTPQAGTPQDLMRVSAGGGGNPVVIRHGDLGLRWGFGSRPRWSPRGDWITFADSKGLMVVSPDGAKSVLVGAAGVWQEAGFTRDGNRVIGVRIGPDRHLWLVSVDIASHKETVLSDINRTIPDANSAHGFSLAPDGKSFLTSLGYERGDIWLLDGFQP